MKKYIAVVLIFIILLIISVGITAAYILVTNQKMMLESADAVGEKYASYCVEKSPYMLTTHIECFEGMDYVCFEITDSTTGQVVLTPDNKWRTMDFKGITFSDSYDVIVTSGDLGTFIYAFQGDGIWQLEVL